MAHTIEITLDEIEGETVFYVNAVNEDRLTHHGFGTFLEKIDPAEIMITDEARELLLAQPERSGLQGLEFWPDYMMAWANPNSEIYVGPADVNVPPDAKIWIKQMSLIEIGD